MKFIRGFVLWLLTSVALYFCGVFTLWIMTLIFSASFENIWTSAIPVTVLSELIMLCYWIYSTVRRKQRRKEN